jgi:hypothetical protein
MPDRPSFASPTKASLAKHHPQLLNRPSSSGSGSGRPGSRGRDLRDVFAKALGEAKPATGGQTVITGEDREGIRQNGSSTQEDEPPLVEAEPEPQRATTLSARSTRSVGGRLSAKPRRMSRSPIKQTANASIEDSNREAAQVNQEEVNPFQRRGLRRSPVTSRAEVPVLDNLDPFQKAGLRRSPVAPEPAVKVKKRVTQTDELPEVSTTPTGPLLSHTEISKNLYKAPSQQEGVVAAEDVSPPQPKAPETMSEVPGQQEAVMASDFLSTRPHPQAAELPHSKRREEPELPPTPTQRGMPDPVVTTPPTGIHDTPSKRARRSKVLGEKLKSSPLKPRDPPPQEPAKDSEPVPQPKLQSEKGLKRRKSARFLLPEDPYASKKKARDDLLQELQQLQADVALANAENKRLLQRSESRTTGPAQPATSNELLAMLLRATAPEPSSASKPEPTSIFKSIGSFLPFQPRRRKHAQLPASKKLIPSHLPIALDDPLPYLQAFSPLTYTSTITILPSEPISSESSTQELQPPIRQRHVINASHSSGLFATRFSMTVDTSTLSITSLDILRLDMNAEKELGTFIRDRARRDGPLGKDVTTICWAMGRWAEVSIQRARFWCAVDSEFGNKQARSRSLARARKKKRKRQTSAVENEEEVNAEGDDAEDGSMRHKWTRKQLLPHLGQTSMELGNEEVELRFEWKIRFDWTGEVDSSITAVARVPKNCKSFSPNKKGD